MAVTKQYWWIVSRDDSGKVFLVFGSDRGEEECRQKALELLAGSDFEIKKLPTKDQGRASALLRGKRLESTHSLKEASQKLGHEKSLKRAKQKVQAEKQSWATSNGW